MQFENPIPLTTIAQLIGATLLGDNGFTAKGINEIHRVQLFTITEKLIVQPIIKK